MKYLKFILGGMSVLFIDFLALGFSLIKIIGTSS